MFCALPTAALRVLLDLPRRSLGNEQDQFHNAESRQDIDRYLQAATVDAESRIRLFKLAADAAVTAFAGREALYEYFFFGDPVRMASAMVGQYDREPVKKRVRSFLSRS